MSEMFNETSYHLGELSAYVHGGARVMYQATTEPFDPIALPWESPGADKCSALRSTLSANMGLSSFGCDAKNGSINLQATMPGDFSDENDVKSLIDGAVSSAGFRYRQSMLRMISNPGGSSSNPMVPGSAGAQPGATPDKSWMDTAGEFWGSAATDIGKALLPTTGAGAGMSLGLLAAIGVGIFVFAKVLR